jgi:hypothetical protein
MHDGRLLSRCNEALSSPTASLSQCFDAKCCSRQSFWFPSQVYILSTRRSSGTVNLRCSGLALRDPFPARFCGFLGCRADIRARIITNVQDESAFAKKLISLEDRAAGPLDRSTALGTWDGLESMKNKQRTIRSYRKKGHWKPCWHSIRNRDVRISFLSFNSIVMSLPSRPYFCPQCLVLSHLLTSLHHYC